MRVSRLMLVTLRDDPAEAEIPSHRLLLRGGYMRRVASGVYAYLPLLWRVLSKISAIVRQEMNATGALETLLPALQPASLWERSGRWQGYTAGEGIMFHLVDRQERSLGLGPTHEEVITALAADLLRSYRQLPVSLYQIQTKFRDEIRPRFGLMRGREFIMKDAYSFHADEADLRLAYQRMDQAYRRIFSRCGLRTVAVEADSGAIGGSASQEFMVTAETGEDLILSSPDGRYAANQERARSLPEPAVPLKSTGEVVELQTPGQHSIEDLCAAHGFEPSQTVKVLILLARSAEGQPRPVLVSLRGDQQLNPTKLANAVTTALGEAAGALLEIEPITPEQIRSEGLPPGPWAAWVPIWAMPCWREPAAGKRASCAWRIPRRRSLRSSSAAPTGPTRTWWGPAGRTWARDSRPWPICARPSRVIAASRIPASASRPAAASRWATSFSSGASTPRPWRPPSPMSRARMSRCGWAVTASGCHAWPRPPLSSTTMSWESAGRWRSPPSR